MSKRTASIVQATTITIAFLTVLIVAADLYAPLKGWLAATFYHHWLGKGVLSLALFALLSLLPPAAPLEKQQKWLMPVVWGSVVALFVFFIWHALATA